jgi:hypothetical protein
MEWGSTMVLPQTSNYRLTWLSPSLAFRFSTGEGGHGLSHRWYRRTILPQGESDGATLDGYRGDGFDVSPMVTGLLVPRVPPAPGAPPPPPSAMPPPPPAVPLGGFASFGSVSSAGGTYTITEQANAGITQSLTIPLGAQSLRFRFKFSAAGDGDFLSVSFGGEFPLYDGLDTVLSRDGFTTVEVSMDGLAGRTGDLTFTLVSRGSANAVIEVADIEWIVDEDPDRDGLTNAQETTGWHRPAPSG